MMQPLRDREIHISSSVSVSLGSSIFDKKMIDIQQVLHESDSSIDSSELSVMNDAEKLILAIDDEFINILMIE